MSDTIRHDWWMDEETKERMRRGEEVHYAPQKDVLNVPTIITTPLMPMYDSTGKLLAMPAYIDEKGYIQLGLHPVIVQAIREEIAAAFREHERRGFDNLMEAIKEPLDETDEMAAVLATLSEEEWQKLVQRLHERKATEGIPDAIA